MGKQGNTMVKIFELSTLQLKDYSDVLLPEFVAKCLCRSYVGIGLSDDEKHIGAIVYDLEKDDEGVPSVTLQWFRILPEYRGNGYAHMLIDALAQKARSLHAKRIYCDILKNSKLLDLTSFLIHQGFIFEEILLHDYEFSFKDILKSPALSKIKPSNDIIPFSKAERFYCNAAYALIRDSGSYELNEHELGSADKDISCMLLSGDVVSAVLLVSRTEFGEMLPLCYCKKKAVPNTVLLALVKNACIFGEEKLRLDSIVRIRCRTDSTAALVKNLFPSAAPRKVLRGRLDIVVAK